MALRRLLLMFAALLAVAALASAIAPRDSGVTEPDTTATAPPGPPPAAVTGRFPRDREVAAQVGDVVDLEVAVSAADEVQIPELGIDATAEPDRPAHLRFVATRSGRFDVRLRFADKRVGVVVIGDER